MSLNKLSQCALLGSLHHPTEITSQGNDGDNLLQLMSDAESVSWR